jgi:hypothetical protein
MDLHCVHELLTSPSASTYDQVKVRAFVAVDGNNQLYLTDDFESYKRKERIIVEAGDWIVQGLYEHFSPYGGGPCLYFDSAEAIGTIVLVDDEMRITQITECIVRRDGVQLQFKDGRVSVCPEQ